MLAPRKPLPFKVFLLNWACVFPGVLLCNALTEWVLGGLHLPETALMVVSTGLLTLSIVYVVNPGLLRLFPKWLRKR